MSARTSKMSGPGKGSPDTSEKKDSVTPPVTISPAPGCTAKGGPRLSGVKTSARRAKRPKANAADVRTNARTIFTKILLGPGDRASLAFPSCRRAVAAIRAHAEFGAAVQEIAAGTFEFSRRAAAEQSHKPALTASSQDGRRITTDTHPIHACPRRNELQISPRGQLFRTFRHAHGDLCETAVDDRVDASLLAGESVDLPVGRDAFATGPQSGWIAGEGWTAADIFIGIDGIGNTERVPALEPSQPRRFIPVLVIEQAVLGIGTLPREHVGVADTARGSEHGHEVRTQHSLLPVGVILIAFGDRSGWIRKRESGIQ